MSSLVMSKLKLSELLDQVYFNLQEKFIALFKESLQESLEQLRDQIIRTPRYQRGNKCIEALGLYGTQMVNDTHWSN